MSSMNRHETGTNATTHTCFRALRYIFHYILDLSLCLGNRFIMISQFTVSGSRYFFVSTISRWKTGRLLSVLFYFVPQENLTDKRARLETVIARCVTHLLRSVLFLSSNTYILVETRRKTDLGLLLCGLQAGGKQ